MYGSVITLYFVQCTCTFVTAHAYISLTLPQEVRYKKDNLTFSCLPSNYLNLASISDLILWKNTLKGWKEIAKVFSDTSSGHLTPAQFWISPDFRDRTVLEKAIIFPSINSILRLTIKAEHVLFTDGGAFRCSINGNLYKGDKLKRFSTTRNMEIKKPSKVKTITSVPATNASDGHVVDDEDTDTISDNQAFYGVLTVKFGLISLLCQLYTGMLLMYATPLLMSSLLIAIVFIITCLYRRQKRLKDTHRMNPNQTVVDILPHDSQSLHGSIDHIYCNANECIYFYENQNTLDVKTQQHEEAFSVCLYENQHSLDLKCQENEETYSVCLYENHHTINLKYQEYDENYSDCLYENHNTLGPICQKSEENYSICLYENQAYSFYENHVTVDLKLQELEEIYSA